MKYLFSLTIALILSLSLIGQENESKIGWFLNPEIGGMFHSDHFGTTLGGSLGIKILDDRLKIGATFWGRPGPINDQTYTVVPVNGQIYKGQSSITLRADHGAAGLYVAPIFSINKFKLEIPLSVGQMGAGFYLLGDDRLTPDGERVSVWEDRLMDGMDAGFSLYYDIGIRAFVPLKNDNLNLGVGLHYFMAPDWETYVDPSGDLYNNTFRLAFILAFESN
ncbi:MAG: hypothetical protein AAF193_04435 [Bacteroidota bacterium]